MTTDMRGEVREWLEAEQAGRADEADFHFRAVSRGLARHQPPEWFADAVVARLRAPRRAADPYSTWWGRAAVAACVTLVGGAAALVPWHVWLDGLVASLQGVAWGFGRALACGSAWLAGGLALWGGLAEAAGVIARQLSGPVPLGLLALNLAVALCALGALRKLMALQEN